MTALTDIQRALNIIRKIVDAEPKTLGLDALVLTNQTAASIGYALKDKHKANAGAQVPKVEPVMRPVSKSKLPQTAPLNTKSNSAIRTGIELAPVKPRAPLPTKSLTQQLQ